MLQAPGPCQIRTWKITPAMRRAAQKKLSEKKREIFPGLVSFPGLYADNPLGNLLTFVALHSHPCVDHVPEKTIKRLDTDIIFRQVFCTHTLENIEVGLEMTSRQRAERGFYFIAPDDLFEYMCSDRLTPKISEIYPALNYYGDAEGRKMAEMLFLAGRYFELLGHFRYKMPGCDLYQRYSMSGAQRASAVHIQSVAQQLCEHLDIDLNRLIFLAPLIETFSQPSEANEIPFRTRELSDKNHPNPRLCLDLIKVINGRHEATVPRAFLHLEIDMMILPIFLYMVNELGWDPEELSE